MNQLFLLSLEGELDLTRAAGGGPELVEQWAGKTMLVLNNAIQTPSGEACPHEFFAHEQLHLAAAADISVAFVGQALDLATLLIPPALLQSLAAVEKPTSAATDQEATALVPGEELPGPQQLLAELAAAPTDLTEVQRQLHAHWWNWYWGNPSPERLANRAKALQLALRNAYPERRLIVSYDYDPEIVARKLWMKRVRLGTIQVHNSLDTAAGRCVNAAVADENLHQPEHLLSRDNVMVLLIARSFDEKLARLQQLFAAVPSLLLAPPKPVDQQASDDESTDADGESASVTKAEPSESTGEDGARSKTELMGLVIDALLVDLCNEHQAVLAPRWRAGLSQAQMRRALPMLEQLAASSSPNAEPLIADSPAGEQFVRFAARLLFYVDSQVRWWEWLPPLPWLRRGPCSRRLTRRALDDWVQRVFAGSAERGDEFGQSCVQAARKLIRAEKKRLVHEFRQLKKSFDTDHRTVGRYARHLLLAPIEQPGITTDAELVQSRVLSRDDTAPLVEKFKKARARRDQLMNQADDARAELLRNEDCQQLLGAAD